MAEIIDSGLLFFIFHLSQDIIMNQLWKKTYHDFLSESERAVYFVL